MNIGGSKITLKNRKVLEDVVDFSIKCGVVQKKRALNALAIKAGLIIQKN